VLLKEYCLDVQARVREIWSSSPGPAKSFTALQTVRHRFNISASSRVALTQYRGDGSANSLHASA